MNSSAARSPAFTGSTNSLQGYLTPHERSMHRQKNSLTPSSSKPNSLDGRAPPDPVPVTPKRAPPPVDVAVLPQRRQPLLVRVKIKPPVQYARRVRGLDETAAEKGLVDEVRCGHDAGAVGRGGGDGLCDLGLEGVDVQDGILLRWC